MSYEGHDEDEFVHPRYNDRVLDFKLRIRMYLKPSEHAGYENRHRVNFYYLLFDWIFSFCFMIT